MEFKFGISVTFFLFAMASLSSCLQKCVETFTICGVNCYVFHIACSNQDIVVEITTSSCIFMRVKSNPNIIEDLIS